MFHFVERFHDKFGLPDGSTDILMGDAEVIKYRADFLQEEVDEFRIACAEDDKVKAFDALLDIVYVAYGTALFMGISGERWIHGFAAVHRANMSKIATPSADASKRHSPYDVIKPEGWVPPEEMLAKILSGVAPQSRGVPHCDVRSKVGTLHVTAKLSGASDEE